MTKAAMKTQVKPLGDNVMVQRLEAETQTTGGIVLPDSAKEKPKEGTVIALGDGKLLDSGERSKFTVKKKDRVLFSSYAGNEIKVDGEDYLLISENDILAILD